MADTSFVHPLTVTLYDLDVRDEVSCATLFRYFEETAIRGSSHFGFTLDWYRQHGQYWVIRTLRMERRCAPRYGQELEIRTWVSSMGRVRSDRNYEVRRARDGELMARGIANWVFVDASQKMPARIHPEIAAVFGKQTTAISGKHAMPALEPLTKLVLPESGTKRFEHVVERTAQFYEADSAQHVNNAVYVDWIEEAVRDALRAMGYALALDESAPLPWFYRHALEYVQAAVPGDNVKLRVCLVKCGHSSGDWQVEIRHAASGDLLLRAIATMLWVNRENHPTRWT